MGAKKKATDKAPPATNDDAAVDAAAADEPDETTDAPAPKPEKKKAPAKKKAKAKTAPKPEPEPEPAAPEMSALWTERVGPFADAIGSTLEDVTAAVEDLVGAPTEMAANMMCDAELVEDDDLFDACGASVPKAVFKNAVRELRRSAPITVMGATAGEDVGTGDSTDDLFKAILPKLPERTSLLAALSTFAGTKVDPIDVVSAMSSKLAQAYDADSIMKTLSDAIPANIPGSHPLWSHPWTQRVTPAAV